MVTAIKFQTTPNSLTTQTRRFLRQSLLLSASLFTIVPAAISAPVIKTARANAPLPRPIASQSQRPLATPLGTRIANGIYLYGEAAQANQLGSAYLVFEVRNSQLKGAVYWPGSSFECLSGQVQADRLALNLPATPNQAATTRNIALIPSGPVASNAKPTIPIGLEGMHPIAPLTENDRRILKTCQAQ